MSERTNIHDELRKMLLAVPFEPFQILTSDGKQYRIRHPELAALGNAAMLIVDPGGGTFSKVMLLHITAIKSAATRKAS